MISVAGSREEAGALPGPVRARLASWTVTGLTLLFWFLAAAAALVYLYSAFCAYTNFKFTLTDYGRYVNTIWNCAHGHPFRLLTEFSYLSTHLSFSLYLLAPFFWFWDDPFVLWIGGWIYFLAGCGIMIRTCLRGRVPPILVASLVLLYLLNPFTQTVLLAEFHGVNLYLLLLPWLHYCCCFQRRWAWLPLVLLWGVREEAAFLAVPMLLYFSCKERWRPGWLLAAGSALYGSLACTVLFSWITGFSLARQRPDVASLSLAQQLARLGRSERILPTLKLLAPALLFLRRGWVPILVFPGVALVMTLLSPYPAQYQLRYHYPTAPLILLMLGIVQSMLISWSGEQRPGRAALACQVVFLLALALIGHLLFGLLPGGRYADRAYRTPSVAGLSAICAARRLPARGVLLTGRWQAGFTANRQDLIYWDQYASGRLADPDLVFTTLPELARVHADPLQRFLDTGEYGTNFFDGYHLIMRKNSAPGQNRRVRDALINGDRTVVFAATRKRGGGEQIDSQCRVVRHWPGSDRSGLLLVAYGRGVKLEPGRYRAEFRLRTGSAAKGAGQTAVLQLVQRQSQQVLVRAEVAGGQPRERGYFSQVLEIGLSGVTEVEPQVLAGGGELWLDRVVFRRLNRLKDK